jgi:hypothetical protein
VLVSKGFKEILTLRLDNFLTLLLLVFYKEVAPVLGKQLLFFVIFIFIFLINEVYYRCNISNKNLKKKLDALLKFYQSSDCDQI